MDLINGDNKKISYSTKIKYNERILYDKISPIKEEGSIPSDNPSQCPICFKTMWSDTKKITCFNCSQKMCNTCLIKIQKNAAEKNIDFSCPFCRFVYDEESNFYTSNHSTVTSIHRHREDNIVSRRRYCYNTQFTLVFIIIIFILLFFFILDK